jgi:hypothetical protein
VGGADPGLAAAGLAAAGLAADTIINAAVLHSAHRRHDHPALRGVHAYRLEPEGADPQPGRGYQPVTGMPDVADFTEEEQMRELTTDMVVSLDGFTPVRGRPVSLACLEGAMIR